MILIFSFKKYSVENREILDRAGGGGSNTYRAVSYFSCVLLGSFPMYKKLGTVQLKKNHFLKHPNALHCT